MLTLEVVQAMELSRFEALFMVTVVRWTLGMLTLKVAQALEVSSESIHFRRIPKGPQLKDQAATLASLSLSHNSSLFVGEGAPRYVFAWKEALLCLFSLTHKWRILS